MTQHLVYSLKVKKMIFDLVNKNPDQFKYLERLLHHNLTQEQVSQSVETFLLYTGNLKTKSTSLDELRYELYLKTIGKSMLTVDFELRKLPPTSAATRIKTD